MVVLMVINNYLVKY